MSQTIAKPFPRHFVLRRLHSLSGLVPIGAFLLEHIFTNAYSLRGPEAFNRRVEALQSLPFVVLIEIFFIFLPLAFHAFYGMLIVYQGQNNVIKFGHEANWRYFAQRVTGVIGLVFVAYHVYTTRFSSYMSGQPMNYQWMQEILSQPDKMVLYLVGSTSLIFHFCNGIWSFLIVWGITLTEYSRKLALYFCVSLFAFLTLVNTLTILNYSLSASASGLRAFDLVMAFVKRYLFGTI